MENPWVQYVSRNYSSIKADLNRRLSEIVPELTDKSPSNLMQILMDMWAGVGELLNYYIDITARELYVGTARRFSSILKLAELVGYNGQAAIPSQTYITITADAPVTTDVEIPIETTLTDTNGAFWVTLSATIIRAGMLVAKASVSQYEKVPKGPLGSTNVARLTGGKILLPTDYSEGSLQVIQLAGLTPLWKKVDNFGHPASENLEFITKLFSDGLVYIILNPNASIPAGISNILGEYHRTKGLAGNAEVGTITTWRDGQPATGVTLTVTNPEPAYGGKNIQGIEEVRQAIPLSMRTLERAVTAKDYEDIAILQAGVRAARISYDCGPYVKLYIVGEGGGNPSKSLLDNVRDKILNKSMVTVGLEVLPSGESHVMGKVKIVGNFRQKVSLIKSQVDEVLNNLYNPRSSKMNQPVRISDVIAAIDNVPSVDYLTLEDFYVRPYLRPSDPDKVLNYKIIVTPLRTDYATFELMCSAVNTVNSQPVPDFVLRWGPNSIALTAVDAGSSSGEVELGGIKMTVFLPSDAVKNDSWTFIVGPHLSDVVLDDRSIPIILQTATDPDFILNIEETFIQP